MLRTILEPLFVEKYFANLSTVLFFNGQQTTKILSEKAKKKVRKWDSTRKSESHFESVRLGNYVYMYKWAWPGLAKAQQC